MQLPMELSQKPFFRQMVENCFRDAGTRHAWDAPLPLVCKTRRDAVFRELADVSEAYSAVRKEAEAAGCNLVFSGLRV
jgi:hypothetical protein